MVGAGDAAERLVREERARVLATLIRVTGDIDLAEDAVQDAVVRALQRWPHEGVPANPRAWLTVTAKRRAIDLVRREARRAGKEAEAMALWDPGPEPAEVVPDDTLRLVFTPSGPVDRHPGRTRATDPRRAVHCGSRAEALLVSEASMAKRLTRSQPRSI
jgi:predicted RNA polymerase sigma factor